MILWIVSWLISMVLLTVLVGIADELHEDMIEKSQARGAFVVFVLPTLLEITAYLAKGSPLWF